MTEKKFLQIAGIIVAFVWVFCGTFAIALTVQRKSQQKIPVTAPPATTTTTPAQQGVFATYPTTAALSIPSSAPQPTTAPVEMNTTVTPTTAATTQATTTQNILTVPQGKEEIVAAYINGVNTLKNTPNFVMNKNDTLNITIDEITGGSLVESFANTLIPSPTPESYTFIGGVDSAKNATPNSTIAPLNTAARVDVNAVTSAVAQQNADGGYTVQLVIQPEVQTYTTPAPNLSTLVQVIDASSLLPSGAKIQEMTVNYEPSTITAVFDSQNRIVSMQHILVSQGGGSGSMLGITASMTMHGDYTSDYTIHYN